MPSENSLSSRHDFGISASRYDLWYQTREGKVFDLFEKQAFLKLMGTVLPGNNLLEVGCGTGWWSSFFSQKGFSVTGVDISPEMIAVAREKNIASATFQVADAHNLPFADNFFPTSAAITSLEFMGEALKVVEEMIRCTQRPGGTIYLGFLNPLAKINIKRRKKKNSFYAKARFFTIEEIHRTFSRFGEVQTTVCAFPIPVKLGPRGIWLDRLETKIGFKHGAFIATRVDL
jgi:ubiquinone/menaquinone biosynthesis C-methylase UbiE